MKKTKPMGNNRWIALSCAAIVFLIDVASKYAVTNHFQLHETSALTSFFNLGYWLNPGAAFSFLSDAGGWQRYFFSAIALAIILWLCGQLLLDAELSTGTRAAFVLIVGGAAGNLYDRIMYGAVVDWIDLHWSGWHWPAFNIADIGIVIGAGLLLTTTWQNGRARTNHAP